MAAAAEEELAEADVDELDGASEGAGSADSKPSNKKRKRASEGGRAKKVERSAAESGSAAPKKRGSRKSNGKKSKDTIESEDDAERADADGEADDAGPSKAQTSPPPPKKTKHNKDDGRTCFSPLKLVSLVVLAALASVKHSCDLLILNPSLQGLLCGLRCVFH